MNEIYDYNILKNNFISINYIKSRIRHIENEIEKIYILCDKRKKYVKELLIQLKARKDELEYILDLADKGIMRVIIEKEVKKIYNSLYGKMTKESEDNK